MASIANNTHATGLPVIPLSPIAQSYIICSNALDLATEKLTEAKKANPPVQLGALRGLLETSKVEAHRLNSLTRKMQSVEAATALYWDSDTLARQIAVIDCQLYAHALLDKRSLSQLDKEQTRLGHLVDFHHYLSHSIAHQLIYWAELVSNAELAAEVVPPVHPTKDSLVTHFVRVAYLLLHAYRDFSGFAAIIKALLFPEVRRLNKKLWHNCNSRTKDMFRELANIISPSKNYAAYQVALRSKLEMYVQGHGGMMVAVPWIQPHLLSIRSIVTAYTAGDNEDQLSLGDIVLSAPGAHKMNMELSLLELCQHNSCTSDFSLEDILSVDGLFQTKPINKRASVAASANKAIHIEGLRAAVIPVANLNHLSPGEQLTHHWLVSRVYLRKDQLINESIEVEPLKPKETIACNSDEFEEAGFIPPASKAVSRRTSSILPPVEHEQELVDMSANLKDDSSSDSDDENGDEALAVPEDNHTTDIPLVASEEEHEVTPPLMTEQVPEDKEEMDDLDDLVAKSKLVEEVVEEEERVSLQEAESDQVELHETELKEMEPKQEVELKEMEPKEVELKEIKPKETESLERVEAKATEPEEEHGEQEQETSQLEERKKPEDRQSLSPSSAASSAFTSTSKQKSRLSPTAPEFVPGNSYSQTRRTESVATGTTDEKWCGYPVREEDEVATLTTNTESEKWAGYPIPDKASKEEEEEEDEVWKGYPGPNSSTDSPRRASSQSETSEEWKGYHATKMEADWQRETALKVQEHEWQGYTLETLDEDELDSSTMMDGEFEKSRQARGQQKQHGKKMNF